MENLKQVNETANELKEKLEREKRRNPGTYERYNHEILGYLRDKFPNEPESGIQEAAAFISYRTSIVVQDLNTELYREWEKTYRRILCRYLGNSGDDFVKLSENVTILEKATGCSLNEIISKLVSGWTLEPPKTFSSMEDLAKRLKEFLDQRERRIDIL